MAGEHDETAPLDHPGSRPVGDVETPDQVPLLASGAMIGRYKIVQVLGEGGFGVVYQAEQTEPVRRMVALKVIKPGMDSRAVVARFEAERQALALMDHPCVAKVLDGGTTPEGRPYFVMELVRGLPITEHCDRHKLSLKERLDLFRRVCDAVQHAHMKGVIHRDLKPGNILVTYSDDTHTPKVIDFGIAKAINQRLTEATVFTQQGMMIGTPEYMSPEQAEMGPEDVDTRSDIYSLGVVLYELLTGGPPLDSKTLRIAAYGEIQRMIRETEPVRPSTRLQDNRDPAGATRVAALRRTEVGRLTATLRRDLDWVVMRCLEKDRIRRYQTANALAEDLARYLRNEPVEAGPPSVSYRLSKFARRHRVGVVIAAVVTMSLLGATAVSALFAASEARARRAETVALADAERARAVSDAVNNFLNDDLLGSVDPDTDGPDVRVVDILDRGAASLAAGLANQPLVEARVSTTIGTSYMRIGRPDKAEPLLRRAILLQAADAEQSLLIESGLIESLWRQGKSDEAVERAERLVESAQTSGVDQAAALRARNQLASSYKYAGRLDDAEREYQAVLAARRDLLGPDHIDTLRSAYNTGLIPVLRGIEATRAGDREQGDTLIEDGLRTLTDVYQRCLASVGDEHSFTLTVASEVTSQLNRLNRVDEAEPIYRRLLATMERKLGASHWRRLQTLANFGRMLQREERHAEAAPALEEAMNGYRQWRTPASADTVTITGWYAASLAAIDRVDDAIDVLGRAHRELEGESSRRASIAEHARAMLVDAGRSDETGWWSQDQIDTPAPGGG